VMVSKRKAKRSRNGQGLVEYALIVSLVAVVAALALGAIGWATQQGFGVITGALGGKKVVQGSPNFLYFDTNPFSIPRCGYNHLSNQTGIQVEFYFYNNGLGTDSLTVRTEEGFLTDIQIGTGGGANYYAVVHPYADGRHPELCPHSVVIQSSKESGDLLAVSPVAQLDW